MDTSIKEFKIKELNESQYIKPFRLEVVRDSKKIVWDCLKAYDSVSVLLFHKDKNAFLLVKQFRPPIWYRLYKQGVNKKESGITYELCSGIMDKGISAKDTIIEEILEETGYEVDEVEKISSFYGDVGLSGRKQTLFFAMIDDSMKQTQGGGIDGEDIELFYLPLNEWKEFLEDEDIIKPASLGYTIYWFFNKFPDLKPKN
ncbi:Nudix-type nucleoside diphosphatase, YffH/AdpP family [Campylobacter blaseri]|uniref:NUDIX hydrolase n=1 Tax=Campylobacter blaseri TaxID=2042961 RepID=A0A2P8QZU2_9BACT|nr:NUDIX hydrolase [Campylobacter blaseri]PSM51767.1 NUDIX hydrolase [Campylobacter blaseri]PSM53558.1 NUDIX hydrolase [Campylobacter blaseri]QKF86366.1 Nudix-type nucleoside diphosphatase, YffH/AdpP family [Campylobacter blaseri]